MAAVRLDLNNPEFQSRWFSLEREARLAVLSTLAKIAGMSWEQIYRDRGLRWEVIHCRQGTDGSRLYSIRLSRKARAVVRRSGEFLEFLTLHPDHDSAYQMRQQRGGLQSGDMRKGRLLGSLPRSKWM
jgi:hypothetical protein